MSTNLIDFQAYRQAKLDEQHPVIDIRAAREYKRAYKAAIYGTKEQAEEADELYTSRCIELCLEDIKELSTPEPEEPTPDTPAPKTWRDKIDKLVSDSADTDKRVRELIDKH